MKKIILLLSIAVFPLLGNYSYGMQKVKVLIMLTSFMENCQREIYHKDSLTCAHKTYHLALFLK